MLLIETYSEEPFTTHDFTTGADIYFMFGRETTGLPKDFAQERANMCLRIPKRNHTKLIEHRSNRSTRR